MVSRTLNIPQAKSISETLKTADVINVVARSAVYKLYEADRQPMQLTNAGERRSSPR
jgi:hypothetical protein